MGKRLRAGRGQKPGKAAPAKLQSNPTFWEDKFELQPPQPHPRDARPAWGATNAMLYDASQIA